DDDLPTSHRGPRGAARGFQNDVDFGCALVQGWPVAARSSDPAVLQRTNLSISQQIERIADRGLPRAVLPVDHGELLAPLEKKLERCDAATKMSDRELPKSAAAQPATPRGVMLSSTSNRQSSAPREPSASFSPARLRCSPSSSPSATSRSRMRAASA